MEINNTNAMFYGASANTFAKATALKKRMTYTELKLWEYLKHGFCGFKFRRQHPIDIFIVDLYCHKAKLVIEIDGEYHKMEQIIEYDKARSEELESYGLKVIRFTNIEVIENIDNVLKRIAEALSSKLDTF